MFYDPEAVDSKRIKDNIYKSEVQKPQQILPQKFDILIKIAAKITTQLVQNPQIHATYDDMEFVLEMVLSAVRKAKGEKEE